MQLANICKKFSSQKWGVCIHSQENACQNALQNWHCRSSLTLYSLNFVSVSVSVSGLREIDPNIYWLKNAVKID